MAIELTFLGHAGWVLSDAKHALVIDPFLTGNPVAKTKPEDVQCQYMALSHGHSDHIADAVPIAKRNKATVIAAFELANHCQQQGCTVEPANPGGKITTDFGWVAFVHAFHSSSHEGTYLGGACGVVVRMGGVTVYHLGDTGLFGDLKLFGEVYRPDIALIPIGDRFTMGPELATKAAEMIRPKVAIPMHYKTFPLLVQDASGFKPQGVEVKILEPGEHWMFGGK